MSLKDELYNLLGMGWTNFSPTKIQESVDAGELVFVLNGEEKDQYNEWATKHLEECEFAKHSFKAGSIGENFQFTFAPNSVGCVIYVKCLCGGTGTFADYDSW